MHGDGKPRSSGARPRGTLVISALLLLSIVLVLWLGWPSMPPVAVTPTSRPVVTEVVGADGDDDSASRQVEMLVRAMSLQERRRILDRLEAEWSVPRQQAVAAEVHGTAAADSVSGTGKAPHQGTAAAGSNTRPVQIVMGLTTVSRTKHNYVHETLLSLLENMNDSEREKAIILLWNGNSPTSEHKELVSALGNDPILVRAQEKGILVVTGRETPYPQLSGPLKQNFGDSMQRIMWRSKQALDFASVMEYAVELQKDFSNPIPFYLQLEDDIIASPGFVTRILNRVHEYEGSGTSWSMLSFYCPHPIADGHRLEAGQFYGFIGQLFRMTDLPSIANYFTVNFDDRPVDWLMKDYIVERKGRILVHSPSLFQHVGHHSSLEGKVQTSNSPTFKGS